MFESSLVRYENPLLITDKIAKSAIETIRKKAEEMILISIEELTNEDGDVIDRLDVLLPPRIIEESGEFWYQKVSREPASSDNLIHLQERLDSDLIRQEAQEFGLCDIRRNVYDQLFDELIRQEVVVCPERGRLLRMIRKESKLSLESLLDCYESHFAYGMKRKFVSIKENAKLKCEVAQLLSDIDNFNAVIRDLEHKVTELKGEIEEREAEKENEFEGVENEISEENESYLNSLMKCVHVKTELEE